MEPTEYQYTATCKGCQYRKICPMDGRNKMYKKKCYLQALSYKAKANPEKLLSEMVQMEQDADIYVSNLPIIFDENEWRMTDNEQRKSNVLHFIANWIAHIMQRETDYIPPQEQERSKYAELIIAILNTCYGAWRNEQFVNCLRCGQIFENSPQRNRKYCNNCAGYEHEPTKFKMCVDCGNEFVVHAPNNRQCRCDLCRDEAKKENARQRAQRYRSKKRHAID